MKKFVLGLALFSVVNTIQAADHNNDVAAGIIGGMIMGSIIQQHVMPYMAPYINPQPYPQQPILIQRPPVVIQNPCYWAKEPLYDGYGRIVTYRNVRVCRTY